MEHWTDEQFEAFWQARNQRMISTARAIAPQPDGNSTQAPTATRRVSDQELFQSMGIAPQGTA